jgi:hypothetical protein
MIDTDFEKRDFRLVFCHFDGEFFAGIQSSTLARMRGLIVAMLLVGCGGEPGVDGGTLDLSHPPRDLAVPTDLAVDDLAVTDLATPDDLATSDAESCSDAACNTPPGDDCSGADDVRTYASPGTCSAGVCSYSPSIATTCVNGCYSGQCSSLFLGNSAAFVTGTATSVGLFGGTATAGTSVSAITQTWPAGSVAAIDLVYSVDDPTFAASTDLAMTYDHLAGSNDQWYAIIPAQSAGTHIYWYIRVTPNSGTPGLDPHGAPTASVLDYTN